MIIDYRENNKWTVYIHIVPKELSEYNWDKYYVGITSTSIKERWGKNGIGYHQQSYFYRVIQKYGWNNIQHKIIAEHLTKNEACKFEKTLIKILKSNINIYGYNLTSGGEGNANCKEYNICQYDLEGNFINVYPNAIEACRELNINTNSSKSLYQCCKGKFKVSHGFQWRFLDKENGIIYKIPACTDFKVAEQEVYQYDSDGNFIRRYDNLTIASNFVYGYTSGIVLCCQGKQKTHKGFQWFYTYQGKTCNKTTIGKAIPVYVYNKEGVFINKFKSIIEASTILNMKKPSKKVGLYPEDDYIYSGYRVFIKYYEKLPPYKRRKNG